MVTKRELDNAGIHIWPGEFRQDNRGRPSKLGVFCLYVLLAGLLVLAFGGRGFTAPNGYAIQITEKVGFTEVKVISRSIWFVGFRECNIFDSVMFITEGRSAAGESYRLRFCVSWPFEGVSILDTSKVKRSENEQ